ncbi:hypothetical protein GE09DRAFT_1218664 [Coniochaeta sp. 2T2.1]|nr:hypothetical protein GE09DRAFT_1218664 [Coniochaeta sp. 2T2.1]
MAPQAQAIDLTGVGYDDDRSPSPPAAPACGNPDHAGELHTARANRRELFACLKQNRDLREAAAGHAAELAKRDNIINELRTRDEGRVTEISRLEAEKAALEDKLSGRGKPQNRTWPEKLQAFVVDSKRMPSYDAIHTLSCKEENMSSNPGLTHPLIRLTGSSNDWKLADANAQGQSDRIFPKFKALPDHIQARIFQLWFHKDRPVHCLSRLDPFRPPSAWSVASSTKSGLMNRFYWGDQRSLNMTEDAVDPQEALALLLVSKDFYFKGVHAFYDLNAFAFSSIGEFGRFANSIGQERAARIQHIDIIWTGSQYLTAAHTFSTNKEGKQVENWDSVRARPLTLLLKLPRLRTLAIFLAESDPRYQRRKYESPEVKAKLVAATTDQPNFRQNRSLRTLQGADCLHLLRGLEWVKVYDLTLMVRDVNPIPELRPIRDQSFLADITNSVTTPKSAKDAEASRLETLPPLFPPWAPSPEAVSAVQRLYRNSQRRGPHPNALSQTWYGLTLGAPADGTNGNVAAADGAGAGANDVGGGPPTVVQGPPTNTGGGVDGNITAAGANGQPASISEEREGIVNSSGTANADAGNAASTRATTANQGGASASNRDAASASGQKVVDASIRGVANAIEITGNVAGGETADSTQGYAATRVVTLKIAPRQLLAIINKAAARADGMAAEVDITDAVQDPSTGTHGDGLGSNGAGSVHSTDTLHNSATIGLGARPDRSVSDLSGIFVDDVDMQPESHSRRISQRADTRSSSQKLPPTQRIQGTRRRALEPLSPAALNARGSNTNKSSLNKRPSDDAGPANTKRRRQGVDPIGNEPATSGGVRNGPTVEPAMTASSAGRRDAQLPSAQRLVICASLS